MDAVILKELLSNDIFMGVVGAGAIGTLAYHARSTGKVIWDGLIRRFTCQMTVYSGDPTFVYLNEWLARQDCAKKARRLYLSTSCGEVDWSLSVGEGRHWVLWRWPPMLVTRLVEHNSISAQMRQELSLRTIGGGQSALRAIVDEAKAIRDGDDRTEVHLWVASGTYWRRVACDKVRPVSSVVLPGGQMKRIVADARRFTSGQEWYGALGVPWRRGYLFHGPPGTGKSSCVSALAGELGRNIYVVGLNSIEDDAELLRCVSEVPQDTVLLLEDIDSSLEQRVGDKSGITLSGLLNALDGVAAGSGRLLVMTSNHPELLDSALVRSGRVDVSEHFGLFGRDEVGQMVERFYPGLELGMQGDVKVQPAALQEMLMSSPASEVADQVAELCRGLAGESYLKGEES